MQRRNNDSVVDPFPVIDLNDEIAEHVREDETMGTKRKAWLLNLQTKERALLKFARPGSGEDWSEKVAHEIACALGIPCPPRLELATSGGDHAVLSWSFLKRGQSLIHGNELLSHADDSYPQHEFYRVPQHTLTAVERVLRAFSPPPNSPRDGVWGDGFDVFVGYLMLDALVGNTDRHHQNWAVVTARDRAVGGHKAWLAPSYDHASSLGRELDDGKRSARLAAPTTRGGLSAYCDKARSALYDDVGNKLATLEAFRQCAALRPTAFRWWCKRLQELDWHDLCVPIERVPAERLSSIGKRFSRELLRYNVERIGGLKP